MLARDVKWKSTFPLNQIIFAPTHPDKNTSCIDDVEIAVLE